MKFPSIKNLLKSVAYVLKRFPIEMLFVLIGTIAGITDVEINRLNLPVEAWCVRIILASNIGLLLSLATTLYCESRGITRSKLIAFKISAALLAGSLVFIINPFKHEADYVRFVLLSLALHLLVAFAPFTRAGYIQGFWQFNKTLFLRFLTSVLYSGVLYLGIAAAMGAMNFLFNFKFEWDSFVILWIWIAGVFNTLFFLAGVPNDVLALDEDTSYPKGLKIFTQYVLIPLASLYVIILIAYEIKILLQWDLPKGTVSDLILGYAVFGILSLLLVFPVRGHTENKWIKTYARSFYFLMLPLIVLLFLAIGTRISHYGITEYRYFLILLAFWLLFITLYFLLSRKQNIKLIPMSLCVLTVLSIYGPQSAFSVSMYSQRRVLVNIFKRNHYFSNDKLMPVDSDKIPHKEANEAVKMLEYMVDHYDLTSLQPYISKDLSALGDSLMKLKDSRYNNGRYSTITIDKYDLRQKKVEWVKNYLNLNKFTGYDWTEDGDLHPELNYSLTANSGAFVDVKGYDHVLLNPSNNADDTATYEGGTISMRIINRGDSLLHILINKEKTDFSLRPLIARLLSDTVSLNKFKNAKIRTREPAFTLPTDMMSITEQTKSFTITLRLDDLRFNLLKSGKIKEVTYVNSTLLIKAK